MAMQLGICPIGWSNDDDLRLGENFTFEQCIQDMAAAGYVGTEIGHKYPKDPAILKSYLLSFGLQISSAWFGTYFTEENRYQETLSLFLEQLSFLRVAGARYINVCECGHSIQKTMSPILGDQKPIFTTRQWEKLIQGLHQIGRIAHDFGIQVLYHFHAGTGVFTAQEIHYLMQNTSPSLIALLLDTGHAALSEIDPIELISLYGSRIRYVHLKDIRRSVLHETFKQQWSFMDAVRQGIFTVPGDGDMHFADIIRALRKLNYSGWIMVEAEQDPNDAPPFEYAKKAYRYLSEWIAG